MDNISGIVTEDDDQLSLPPGFRFHPTDEELITDYLSNKVRDSRFCAIAIGEADLNNTEPWDLPSKAKIGEREWYFFVLRDKKYPTGLRTNRATESGYWKATGKDKEIYRGRSLVGMKKTLVFYTGRAPKGEKTDWVMHEFRLDGTLSVHNLPQSAKIEWVICRVFKKTSGGKKIHISSIIKPSTLDNDLALPDLPPLTNSDNIGNPSTVPCFSNPINVQSHLNGDLDDPLFTIYSNHIENPLKIEPPNSYYSGDQYVHNPLASSQYPNSFLENYEPFMMHGFKQERDMVSDVTQDTGLTSDMNNEISSNFDMAYLLSDDYNFY